MGRKLHNLVQTTITTVTTEKNIGKVRLTLREFMEREGVTRNQLSNATGVKMDTLNRYYYNKLTRYDGAILALFCRALDCDLADILTYELNEK